MFFIMFPQKTPASAGGVMNAVLVSVAFAASGNTRVLN